MTWSKGESGNPKGSELVPWEAKETRNFNRRIFEDRVCKLLVMTPREIEEVEANRDSPAIDLWLARGIKTGIISGDLKPLNSLLDRAIGKASRIIEDDENDEYENMSLEELIEITQESIHELRPEPDNI